MSRGKFLVRLSECTYLGVYICAGAHEYGEKSTSDALHFPHLAKWASLAENQVQGIYSLLPPHKMYFST